MELSALTHSELIFIDPPHRTPEAVIGEMSAALFRQGLINDKAMFIDSVLRRESEGPTALGESLAVPHGKCGSVVQAAFSVALFRQPVMWPGLEGDEEVQLVFLLAIPPEEAGSTHMQLLTRLTSSLVDDKVRESLINASSAEEVLALLSPDVPSVSPEPTIAVKNTRLVPLVLGIVAVAAFINAGIHWMNATVQ